MYMYMYIPLPLIEALFKWYFFFTELHRLSFASSLAFSFCSNSSLKGASVPRGLSGKESCNREGGGKTEGGAVFLQSYTCIYTVIDISNRYRVLSTHQRMQMVQYTYMYVHTMIGSNCPVNEL